VVQLLTFLTSTLVCGEWSPEQSGQSNDETTLLLLLGTGHHS
jgi:hypothetical protein